MAEDPTNVAKGPVAEHSEPIQADVLAAEARRAADAETSMTLLQAIKTYPKAIGWSVLLSSTLIMEGYDLALLGNLYASPVFNKKYGQWSEADEKYVIDAAWQSGLSNGARAGEIIGLIIAGWFTDRYGTKMTTVGFLVMMICTVFALFFAPNVKVLVAGEVLCGKLISAPKFRRATDRLTHTPQASRGARSRASPLSTHPRSPPSSSVRISRPLSTCVGLLDSSLPLPLTVALSTTWTRAPTASPLVFSGCGPS